MMNDGTYTPEIEESQLRTARTTRAARDAQTQIAQLKAQVARLASDKEELYCELAILRMALQSIQELEAQV